MPETKPTRWKGLKSATGDWIIVAINPSGTDEIICRELRHWNKDLIVAAVNACKQVNETNPLAPAEVIKEAFEALKQARWCIEHHNIPGGIDWSQILGDIEAVLSHASQQKKEATGEN